MEFPEQILQRVHQLHVIPARLSQRCILVSQKPSDMIITPGNICSAVDLVRLVMSAAIDGGRAVHTPPVSIAADVWKEFIRIIRSNRLEDAAISGCAALEITPPSSALSALQSGRQQTAVVNFLSIATLRYLAPLFDAEGIRWATYKGVAAQSLLYGTFFKRTTTDVDILVAPQDFKRAAAMLQVNGYELNPVCRSFWWRGFLGEQHFLSAAATRTMIDLHLSLRQPGSPGPRGVTQLMAATTGVSVGDVTVPTFPRPEACLIACVQLAKAFIHREPAGRYLEDIAGFLVVATPDELRRLDQLARAHQLVRVVRLARRSTAMVFGVDQQDIEVLASLPDETLSALLLAPTQPGLLWPRRVQLLAALCDTPIQYVRELGFRSASEVARLVLGSSDAEPAPVIQTAPAKASSPQDL